MGPWSGPGASNRPAALKIAGSAMAFFIFIKFADSQLFTETFSRPRTELYDTQLAGVFPFILVVVTLIFLSGVVVWERWRGRGGKYLLRAQERTVLTSVAETFGLEPLPSGPTVYWGGFGSDIGIQLEAAPIARAVVSLNTPIAPDVGFQWVASSGGRPGGLKGVSGERALDALIHVAAPPHVLAGAMEENVRTALIGLAEEPRVSWEGSSTCLWIGAWPDDDGHVAAPGWVVGVIETMVDAMSGFVRSDAELEEVALERALNEEGPEVRARVVAVVLAPGAPDGGLRNQVAEACLAGAHSYSKSLALRWRGHSADLRELAKAEGGKDARVVAVHLENAHRTGTLEDDDLGCAKEVVGAMASRRLSGEMLDMALSVLQALGTGAEVPFLKEVLTSTKDAQSRASIAATLRSVQARFGTEVGGGLALASASEDGSLSLGLGLGQAPSPTDGSLSEVSLGVQE